MRRRVPAAALAFAFLLLTACGQRGPLFLPDEQKQETAAPAPQGTPAPPSEVPAPSSEAPAPQSPQEEESQEEEEEKKKPSEDAPKPPEPPPSASQLSR